MIYFALVPLTVGEAGEGFICVFLARRLQLEKKEQDEERIEARVFMCRFIARFLGAAIANLWISKLDWKPIFMSSAIVTGTVYLLFGFGFVYYYKRLNQSSSTEREDSMRSLLNRFFLSKTQRRRESNSRPRDHESYNNGKKELWLFLRKLPLWFPFLFYYVVDAAGSTFFMEQTDKLNDKIGENYQVPSPQSSFLVVQKCTKFIASNLADYLIKKFCKDDNQERRAGLVRMSLGMCACSGCCIVAWLLENHRLDLFNDNPDRNPIPMSILLLAPQFSLLGFAHGLIEDGMEEFFRDYAPASIHHFAMAFTKAVDAGGKLIAVVFILTLKNWIGEDVNTSHLDSYYRMLAILVLCALQFFIILANNYDWEIEKKEGDDELDKVLKQLKTSIVLDCEVYSIPSAHSVALNLKPTGRVLGALRRLSNLLMITLFSHSSNTTMSGSILVASGLRAPSSAYPTSLDAPSVDESLETKEWWLLESPPTLEPALLSGVIVSSKSYSSGGTIMAIGSTDITPSSSSLPWLS
ncbi:hypothetical protein SLEP1_g57707 [Rubroshorea leprosula]|uniref:Uncharacterized protein n=1 Tax=Rubroshorea leprosula TaxID=152421 RepID=A0AAV5MNA5_9ROSI|nr:hypothetical protein SLEP1_g57707 [Rubroshorea leprosula]